MSDNSHNYLSPLGFNFVLQRAPELSYNCQQVTLPTISGREAIQPTAFVNIPRPGDKMDYDAFSITFLVDEDMKNYLEIQTWMEKLYRPENFEGYRRLREEEQPENKVTSDGTLIIRTSNQNANLRVFFQDMFPLTLSPITFDAAAAEVNYLQAEVSFRYTLFKIENVN